MGGPRKAQGGQEKALQCLWQLSQLQGICCKGLGSAPTWDSQPLPGGITFFLMAEQCVLPSHKTRSKKYNNTKVEVGIPDPLVLIV